MMPKGCCTFLIAGSGKATQNVAAARNNDGATKNTRAQEETSPGPPADARPLGHKKLRRGPAATPRQLESSAPRKAKSVSTAKVLRKRIKRNDAERLLRLLDCRKWKSHPKRCGSPKQRRGHEKHARTGGNEPGTTRGRAATRPQKLRRGPAAPAAHARTREPDPESAQV